jgi:hypothetical protein
LAEFSNRRGRAGDDGRRVLSGTIFMNCNSLRLCDAIKEYGLYKTISIDATYLKAQRKASSLWLKDGGREPVIGRNKVGMKMELHAVTDTIERLG